MSKPYGRNVPISAHRRLVMDLMHFSRKVPSVAIDRPMNLARVAAARERAASPPTWTAIFMKAYALVAARMPQLRQAYLSFPWGRLYEHHSNNGSFNVVRRDGDEDIIVQANIRRPENRSLADLDTLIRTYQEKPLEELVPYCRARRLARLPWPLRWLTWWGGLNWFGRRRAHNFGTFSVTTVCGHGAGTLHLVALLTSTLHYGLFDNAGNINMRLTIDHRVLDGVAAAQALVQLEKVLHTEILAELRGTPMALAA